MVLMNISIAVNNPTNPTTELTNALAPYLNVLFECGGIAIESILMPETNELELAETRLIFGEDKLPMLEMNELNAFVYNFGLLELSYNNYQVSVTNPDLDKTYKVYLWLNGEYQEAQPNLTGDETLLLLDEFDNPISGKHLIVITDVVTKTSGYVEVTI